MGSARVGDRRPEPRQLVLRPDPVTGIRLVLDARVTGRSLPPQGPPSVMSPTSTGSSPGEFGLELRRSAGVTVHHAGKRPGSVGSDDEQPVAPGFETSNRNAPSVPVVVPSGGFGGTGSRLGSACTWAPAIGLPPVSTTRPENNDSFGRKMLTSCSPGASSIPKPPAGPPSPLNQVVDAPPNQARKCKCRRRATRGRSSRCSPGACLSRRS
jgi:hypothetical protein